MSSLRYATLPAGPALRTFDARTAPDGAWDDVEFVVAEDACADLGRAAPRFTQIQTRDNLTFWRARATAPAKRACAP